LDRDGTVIVDQHYPRDPDAVRLLPGCAPVLRALVAAGSALYIVSNQSGVARGIISPAEAEAVHERTLALLRAEGVPVADHRYCFHGPDAACSCRKPAAGMLLELAEKHTIDLRAAVMVGDKPSDVAAGVAAGCRTIALGLPQETLASARVKDWAELQTWLERESLSPSR